MRDTFRIGVIAHLFYPDLIEASVSYFRNLPDEVELVITTPEAQMNTVERCLLSIGRKGTLLPAGNRGRDVAALLVTAHEYLMKYDILCFIHDKKTTGGVGDSRIGDVYRRLLWDSLMGTSKRVNEILEWFKSSPLLGVVAPPAPYHDSYFLCLGDPWATSLPMTQRVLDLIGVNRCLTGDDIPRALSTAFWCRTVALKKMFLHAFTYNDFPEEPLPLNGAINHGVERAISFVAEEAGFQTEIVSERGHKGIQGQEQILTKLCNCLAKRYYFTTLEGVLDEIDNQSLKVFCLEHECLLVYGAGYHGQRVLPILERMGFHAQGFVISDGQSKPENAPLPVSYLSSIQVDTKVGMIVAAAHAYQPIMKKALEENGWDLSACYFLK